jgi:hypothetical protein
MAKKTVATLKKADAKTFVKVIKMVKSEKSGSYSFQESVVPSTDVDEVLKG